MISKIVKVSDKGQISLPVEIRKSVGIHKNDSLMLMQLDDKIIIEKPEKRIKESFADLIDDSVMRGLWDNKYDEVWDKV